MNIEKRQTHSQKHSLFPTFSKLFIVPSLNTLSLILVFVAIAVPILTFYIDKGPDLYIDKGAYIYKYKGAYIKQPSGNFAAWRYFQWGIFAGDKITTFQVKLHSIGIPSLISKNLDITNPTLFTITIGILLLAWSLNLVGMLHAQPYDAERIKNYYITTSVFLFIFFLPLIMKQPYQLDILNFIALNAMVVLGLNLLITYTGLISLGHAAFWGLGAYGSAILTVMFGVYPWFAIIVVAILIALIAFVIGVPITKLTLHHALIATFGFNIFIFILLTKWISVTGGSNGYYGIAPLVIFGIPINNPLRFYYLVWTFVVVSFSLCLTLVRYGFKRGLTINAKDETGNIVGDRNTRRMGVAVFVLSAVFPAISGSLYSHYYRYISPNIFNIFRSLEFVVAAIIGGMGSIWGTLFGVPIVTFSRELLGDHGIFRNVIYGLIIVSTVIFLPKGFKWAAILKYSLKLAKPKNNA